jgi:hypothetical protein
MSEALKQDIIEMNLLFSSGLVFAVFGLWTIISVMPLKSLISGGLCT